MKTKKLPLTIEEIYINHKESVFNHIMRIVKKYHDSEEITEDVFIKIMRLNKNDKTRFNPEKASIGTWIYTITNTVILDYFRTNHQNRYQSVSDFTNNESKEVFNFIAPSNTQADNDILNSELQEKILKAFRTLKPKYRKVAMLYFIRGYDYNELADMLNIPMGTVKGTLARAREKLQLALKGVYELKTEIVETY